MPARFFIVGTGRCGTELLMKILNSHPDVLVFSESFFLLPALNRYGLRRINSKELMNFALSVFHYDGQSTLRKALFDLEINHLQQEIIYQKIMELNCNINAFEILDLIGNETAKIVGKSSWADKTPDAGYYAKKIGNYWEKTFFIHIYRDGYRVAKSMENHKGFKANIIYNNDEWVPLSIFPKNFFLEAERNEDEKQIEIKEFIELWGRRFLYIENQLNHLPKSQVLKVSFEDLVSHSKDIISKICSSLDLKWDDKWLSIAVSMIDPSKKEELITEKFLSQEFYSDAYSAKEANIYSIKLREISEKEGILMQKKEVPQVKTSDSSLSVQERDTQISSLYQTVAEREEKISELNDSLLSITNSFYFQITRPLRKLGKYIPTSLKNIIKVSAKFMYFVLTPHNILGKISQNKKIKKSNVNDKYIELTSIIKSDENIYNYFSDQIMFVISVDSDAIIENDFRPNSPWSHNINLFYIGQEALRSGNRVAIHIIGRDTLIEVKTIYPKIKIISKIPIKEIQIKNIKYLGIYPSVMNDINKLLPKSSFIHNIFFVAAIHWLESPELMEKEYIDNLRKSALLYIDDIIVQNKEMGELIYSLIVLCGIQFDRERIIIGPCGFVPEDEDMILKNSQNRNEIRKEMNLTSKEIGIINSGGVWKWTDLDTFLESFIEFHREVPNNKLIFFIMGFVQKNNKNHSDFIGNIKKLLDRNNDLIEKGYIRIYSDYEFAGKLLPKFNFGADLGVNVSKTSMENSQSYRQRFVEYVKAGLPVINTVGDPMSRSKFQEMMITVEPEKIESYKRVFRKLIEDPSFLIKLRNNVPSLRDSLRSDQVYLPVIKMLIKRGPINPKIRLEKINSLKGLDWVKKSLTT